MPNSNLYPTLNEERSLAQQGFPWVAGIDEAGRGAWAGPVVASAVILPLEHPVYRQDLANLNDSKKLSARQRDRLFEVLQDVAVSIGVGYGPNTLIDNEGIIAATRHAMHKALSALKPKANYLLIDALPLPAAFTPQRAFFKAESSSLSVAAASIIAKVSRDRLMIALDEQYPGYHFAKHKGYGTKAHQHALQARGPCPIHRFSFAPIKELGTGN